MSKITLLPVPKRVAYSEGTLALQKGVRVTDNILNENTLRFALGEFLSEKGVSVAIAIQNGIAPEGYSLEIKKEGISVACGGNAGAFYALLTLRQILLQSENGVAPLIHIEDEPDFPARGLMVDISRNRIPNNQTLREIVDFAAYLKFNQFQLYIEGKPFYFPSLAKFYGKDADVLTPDDVLSLDLYCRERFIDFVPNLNTFGHMAPWLAHKELNDLAECPDGFSFYGTHVPASTLDPLNEESVAFVKTQIDDLLPLFSSGKVNLGGDEPFELGMGKSARACEQEGKSKVYLDFMKKIFAAEKPYGKQPMMWGDVYKEHYKDYKDCFPKDITVLEWGYEAGSYTDEVCSIYEEAGVPYYLCPGTSMWNTVAGKTENMRQNVISAARLGKKHNASGILLVDWGDGGTCQPYTCSFLPYATGAAYAWNADAEQQEDIAVYLNKIVFGDQTQSFAQILADLGNYYLAADKDDPNATKIFKTLYVQQTDCMNNTEGNYEPLFTNRDFARLSERECLKTLDYLTEIGYRISKVKLTCPAAALCLREVRWALGYLMHGCKLGAIKADEKQFTRAELQALYDELAALNKEYEEVWRLRNRRTGLRESTMRMRALLKKYGAILGSD